MIRTTVTGPGTLSFYWKVSSDDSYDFLKFKIDGVIYSQMSGEVDWHKVTYEIASGSHTLMWIYTKDESDCEESHAGWLVKSSLSACQPTIVRVTSTAMVMWMAMTFLILHPNSGVPTALCLSRFR